ncbi:MAG TPA: hypothetical protein VHE14_00645 [Solirubrobacteraceae bacterium]|nr:hypothetical protein [Solirubrobacteraceae bacterium]
MTAFRLIPFTLHGAIELLIGLALMVAPFALGFTAAGTLAAVLIGAMLFGLALGTSNVEPGGRGVSIAAHYSLDVAAVLGLLGAALVLALAGDRNAGIAFVAAFAAQLALATTTRYSERG